jgi:hypothetical protein
VERRAWTSTDLAKNSKCAEHFPQRDHQPDRKRHAGPHPDADEAPALEFGPHARAGIRGDAVTHITDRIPVSGGYPYVAATVTSFPTNPALLGL